jgi:RHH-type proline utilization regulon transcriptional repressor/proline dehydrogenase/delta 1-pyrroline-5-carboxylate dehydrogenase
VLSMLMGAMDVLIIGDPSDPATDVGPLIDRAALERIEESLLRLHRRILG